MTSSSFEARQIRHASDRLMQRIDKARARIDTFLVPGKREKKGIVFSFLSWFRR